MYIPAYYKEDDRSRLTGFIRSHSFGVLISGGDGLQGTHLPMLLEERGEQIFLVSHLSRANPQWKQFGSDQEFLAIFTGPHGYVSPSNYEKQQNVPTWNYVAVHVYGTIRALEEKESAIAVLEKTITMYEESYMQQWKQLSAEYVDKMVRGIVAFEMEISRMEGKYKLSQNKTQQEQRNVISSFERQGDSISSEVAELMKKNLK